MINDYVPMLIVSINKDGEYIHIRKANNEDEYKCPCCGAKIKARAMESDKVQPHFYHSEGSECNKENIAHWIYKNWLFNSGCKFIINKDGINEEYQVNSIDIEKLYNTKFGVYKPDITVTTSCGKIIYFEINYSNKKDVDDYFCKWNELGNDVVEVNVRELINADLNHSTPTFSVIYSDGDYLKKYEKKSRDDIYRNTIKVYKEAVAESDYENCKRRFEQLDWFWIILQKYKLMKISEDEVLTHYSQLNLEDMTFCYLIAKRLKCFTLQNKFIKINNTIFMKETEFLDISPFSKIEIIQESPRIAYISFLMDSINGIINYYYGYSFNANYKFYNYEILNYIKNIILSDEFKQIKLEKIPHREDFIKIYKDNPFVNVNMYKGDREYISATDIKQNKTFYKYVYENTCYSVDGVDAWRYLTRKISEYETDCEVNKYKLINSDLINKIKSLNQYNVLHNYISNKIKKYPKLEFYEVETPIYKKFNIVIRSGFWETLLCINLLDNKNIDDCLQGNFNLIIDEIDKTIQNYAIDIDSTNFLFNHIEIFENVINSATNKMWRCEKSIDDKNNKIIVSIYLLEKCNRIIFDCVNDIKNHRKDLDEYIKKSFTDIMIWLLKNSGLYSNSRAIEKQ